MMIDSAEECLAAQSKQLFKCQESIDSDFFINFEDKLNFGRPSKNYRLFIFLDKCMIKRLFEP